MSVDRDRPPLFPASGAGGWLREGVARRPGMAGGMSTDGSRLTPTVYMSRQPAGSQSVLTIGFESTPRLYQKVRNTSYQLHGDADRDVRARRRLAPWYPHTQSVSYSDMLAALRRELIRAEFHAQAHARRSHHEPRKPGHRQPSPSSDLTKVEQGRQSVVGRGPLRRASRTPQRLGCRRYYRTRRRSS